MRQTKIALQILGLLILSLGFVAGSSRAQDSRLHITSPASGTVVRPGETLRIAITAETSVERLAVFGERPLGVAQVFSGAAPGVVARGQGEARPIEFLLQVPPQTRPGNYRLTAIGRVASDDVDSAAITIDVEKPDEPLRIWAEPARIQFTGVGERIPIRVLGEFANGSNEELTRSHKTTFASGDPQVATVSEGGMVIATGAGKTTVQVRIAATDYLIPIRVQ